MRELLARKIRPVTAEALARQLRVPETTIVAELEALRALGHNVQQLGDQWALEKTPPTGGVKNIPPLVSDAEGWHKIGCVSDTHLCSVHERLDLLKDAYRLFEANGVQRVMHSGNYIDGEARFNRYELLVHGMDRQVQYLGEHYPQVKGLETWAISGDDHEGWYCQQSGVDIGRYVEDVMHRGGRSDWKNLGYLEAFVPLIHKITGATHQYLVMHPGGGSAYATSYTVQKIIECVPRQTEALTPSGWVFGDQLAIGDSILGYNRDTEQCEWTSVLALHRGVAEVFQYSNDQITVQCTANHLWPVEFESRGGANPRSKVPARYSKRRAMITTLDEAPSRCRLIQAAPAPSGAGLAPRKHEEWLNRAHACAIVLQMTGGERRAYIEGLLQGEGNIVGGERYRSIMFSQNPGQVHEAFRLACLLEGIATTSRERPAGSFKPHGPPGRIVTLLKKPFRLVDKLKITKTARGTQSVWCPTTELGTWVMRQGDTTSITGNSLEGGEKPAVLQAGHYHKTEFIDIRNVWTIQPGCLQDQTIFARKKKIVFSLAASILMLRQNPSTGAIEEAMCYMKRYFNQGYYVNQRWSLSGPVSHVPRLQP